jgi:Glu-tRNA(Gln) amidotransferase subunit E-like FAD-binding protein
MKCDLCKRKVSSLNGVPSVGMACKRCVKKAVAKRKRLHGTLRKESLGKMPKALNARQFDRYALKLAIHTLDALPEKDRAKLRERMPLALIPEEAALDIKERILNAVIGEYRERYIVMKETKGRARWASSGTYQFKEDIPAAVLLSACKKADLVTTEE